MSQSLNPARLNRAPTTDDAPLGSGLAVAVLLHVAVIAFAVATWPHKLEIVDDSPQSVPVDLITVADKNNVIPTIDRTQKPAPAEDVAPPAPPTPTPTPPPAQAEVAPSPTPSPVAKPAPAPLPTVKPQPPSPDKPKPKSDDFNALLNKLTAPAATPRNARVADRTVKGLGAMSGMTADLATALKSQIVPCWSPPVGAPRADQLVVDFDLSLNPDGSVARPPQLTADSAARAASDPYTRAAAEAARRAIMTCAPYKLPVDRYGQWRDISPFHFDPRQMMGQ